MVTPASLPGHPDYVSIPFEFPEGHARRVYAKGTGKPIVLMHELPGLAEPCVLLAERLVKAGYAVYLPLLFGEPMQEATGRNLARLCISREFVILRSGVTSPATEWLRALVRHVSKRHAEGRVGVIGMCLSGGFVIPLILESKVGAAVTSQPGLPLRLFPFSGDEYDLGVSEDDMKGAAERATKDGVCLFGFRFTADTRSPSGRFAHLRKAFGGQFDAYEIPTPDPGHGLDKGAHSVLTYEYKKEAPPTHPTRIAMEKLLSFLKAKL